MPDYRRNHYVPQWYQYRFLKGADSEKKFYYLDLNPESRIQNGHAYKRKSLLRWGPPRCFCEDDLYTTKYGEFESTEIEQYFFGKVDTSATQAVEYFSSFQHPSVDEDALNTLLPYMSIQKLRTPKGLGYLSGLVKAIDKNHLLTKMQELQQMFCALWTECVWSIASAAESETKFLLSDHPVTVYNRACFPGSKPCQGYSDPGVWQSATHTLFPLDQEKILILTNLSWVRNPYGSPLKNRPNPKLFRGTLFNFLEIQTGRVLSEQEVTEINYIIKSRAHRYIAAEKEEWLYPERKLTNTRWDRFGKGYLLMPDPRSVQFTTGTVIGYKKGQSDGFDAYGRKPWQDEYNADKHDEKEWATFHAFQGEFARLHGPIRRGISYQVGGHEKEEDSPDFHKYHLSLEQKYKPKHTKKRRRK